MTPWGQGDDGTEDGPWTSPPPQDDRLWRHPSEQSAAWLRSPEARRMGRPALSVLVGVLVGAALATAGVVLASGGTTEPATGRAAAGGGNGTAPHLSPSGITVVPTASTVGSAAVGPLFSASVDRLSGAMVQVEADRGASTRRGCGFSTGTGDEVVTAAALVDGAGSLSVVTGDGTRVLATLLGTDPMSGVAVLRFGGAPLRSPQLSSGAPRSGDVVMAVTLGSSRLAMGEVTAVGVNSSSPAGYPVLDAIATDLPEGSSGLGAPVLDSRGAIVGMVVSAGSGRPTLAMPIGTVRQAAGQLAASGTVAHGWLGVDRVTPTSAGVSVASVASGSPAAGAGIATGDVIVAVDGRPVRSMEDLQAGVGLRSPGQTVTVELSRAPRTWSVRVVLGRLPEP